MAQEAAGAPRIVAALTRTAPRGTAPVAYHHHLLIVLKVDVKFNQCILKSKYFN